MYIWIYVYMYIWIYEYMDIWIYEYIWLFKFSATRRRYRPGRVQKNTS